MVGVHKSGHVDKGIDYTGYQNTKPASTLLVTEVFKAIKKYDTQVHL